MLSYQPYGSSHSHWNGPQIWVVSLFFSFESTLRTLTSCGFSNNPTGWAAGGFFLLHGRPPRTACGVGAGMGFDAEKGGRGHGLAGHIGTYPARDRPKLLTPRQGSPTWEAEEWIILSLLLRALKQFDVLGLF